MLDVQAVEALKLKDHRTGRRPFLTDQDDAAEAAGRLEQALDRIAFLSARPSTASATPISPQSPLSSQPPGIDPANPPETEALAVRLDALIARLRSVLGPEGGV